MPWRHQFPILDDGLRDFRARPVVAVERPRRQVAIELRTIGGELCLQTIEHLLGKAERIGRRLHHERRHRADQRCLGHPAFAMPGQVMRHFSTAGRVPHVDGVFQVEMRRQSRQVVGVTVHIVAVGGLGRTAMATAVMGNYAIAVMQEEQQLRVPIIGRQRACKLL